MCYGVFHYFFSCINTALAKCSKLSTLVHSSTKFNDEFSKVFGDRTVPQLNNTRWNSMYTHIKGVLKLTKLKLNDLLTSSDYLRLKLSNREWAQLEELQRLLEPFLEATNYTQGENVCSIII